MSFIEDLWAGIKPIYRKILDHPFIKGLVDGSLEEERFRFYVVQDALYLREYAKSIALLSAKAPEEGWTAIFADHARMAIEVEKYMDDHINAIDEYLDFEPTFNKFYKLIVKEIKNAQPRS